MHSSIIDRSAFKFFLERAGYATPPGRVACAAQLARAESWARAMERDGVLRVTWQADPEPYELGDAEREYPDEVLGCVVESRCPCCGAWEHVASLWSIGDPDDDYRRVVEAELAQEAFTRLSASPVGCTDEGNRGEHDDDEPAALDYKPNHDNRLAF
jgi:hypothetical protein